MSDTGQATPWQPRIPETTVLRFAKGLTVLQIDVDDHGVVRMPVESIASLLNECGYVALDED